MRLAPSTPFTATLPSAADRGVGADGIDRAGESADSGRRKSRPTGSDGGAASAERCITIHGRIRYVPPIRWWRRPETARRGERERERERETLEGRRKEKLRPQFLFGPREKKENKIECNRVKLLHSFTLLEVCATAQDLIEFHCPIVGSVEQYDSRLWFLRTPAVNERVNKNFIFMVSLFFSLVTRFFTSFAECFTLTTSPQFLVGRHEMKKINDFRSQQDRLVRLIDS